MEVIYHLCLIFNPRWLKHLSGWLNVDKAVQQGERKQRERRRGCRSSQEWWLWDSQNLIQIWWVSLTSKLMCVWDTRTHSDFIQYIDRSSFFYLINAFICNNILGACFKMASTSLAETVTCFIHWCIQHNAWQQPPHGVFEGSCTTDAHSGRSAFSHL